MDLATALDLKSPDDVIEAKFGALKALHARKIKSLMQSLDAKDKDIAKLKVLGKDSRRTQMIQALRDKIRGIELVTDVVKEELGKRAEMSPEEVNDFVIRKTIAGPKRFRPLTREELENKVIDMEKKLAVKKAPSVAGSVAGGLETKSVAASEKSGASRRSKRDESKEEGDAAEEEEQRSAVGGGNSRSGGGGGGGGGTGAGGNVGSERDTGRIVQLMEEVEALRLSLDVSEGAVELQKEEVSRLRERNAQLVAGEEESDFATRQYREMRAAYEAMAEDLEACTRRLAEATEENMMLRGEADVASEQQTMELETLHDQCERLLGHNATLLVRLGEMEIEVDAAFADRAKAGNVSASAEAGEQAKTQALVAAEKRLLKVRDQLKQAEARVAELTSENQQIALLTNTLREKNVMIRDLNRKLDDRTASPSPDRARTASIGSLGSGRTGLPDDVAAMRRQVAELRDENKQLSQALSAAALGKSPTKQQQQQQSSSSSSSSSLSLSPLLTGSTALLGSLIDALVQQGPAAGRALTAAAGQAAERLLKILDGLGGDAGEAASLVDKAKVEALLELMDASEGKS